MEGTTLILFLTAFAVLLNPANGQCTFPTDLNGTWVSSSDGTWTINTTHILNYKTVSEKTGSAVAVGKATMNFECWANNGDTKYVIRSESFELFTGSFVSLHTCIDIRPETSIKLIYYQATALDPFGFRLTINDNYTNVCNLASYTQAYNYRVALKSGSETSALTNCPSSMYGSYNYDTCTDVISNGTSLDVCDSRQQVILNYTLCNTTQLFSMDGVLDCVYYTTSGSVSYLTLYNRDSTPPDDVDYYRYTCLAVQLTDGTVYLTANPNKCKENQNATAIASPGQSMQLTPYYLCPITSDSNINILPIILGILGAILFLALLILIIYCCWRRRCRKKKSDEEDALSDESDKEEEEQQKKSDRTESRRSSEQDSEEKKSIDSGICEPPMSDRTGSKNQDDSDGDLKSPEQETVLILTSEGEKEADDKDSRPCSGERSRMSDLPPSTLPPDDDQPLSNRTDEEQEEKIDNDSVEIEKTQEEERKSEQDEEITGQESGDMEEAERDKTEEPVSEDEDNEDEEEVETETDKESEKEDKMEMDEEENKQQGTKDNVIHVEPLADDKRLIEDTGQTEEEEHVKAETRKEESDEEQQKELEPEMPVPVKGGQTQQDEDEPVDEQKIKDKREKDIQKDSDEEIAERKKTTYESSDDEGRQHTLIGGKGAKHYIAGEGLTKVLVSREEEERKKLKLQSKSKKQKMRKLAKRKTRKFGGKHGKGDKGATDSEDEFNSSDEETRRRRGYREAPFMKQYEDKKHIEHILDEQHYWSDPEADKDEFKMDDHFSSIFDSDSDSGNEDEVIGPDGSIIKVKKSKRKHKQGARDGDDISIADSEYLRKKMLKRAGSLDSLASVEDTDNIDKRKSKRKLNEHTLKTDSDEEARTKGNKRRSKENQYLTENDLQKADDDKTDFQSKDKKNYTDTKKTKTILVKEHSDMSVDSFSGEEKGGVKDKSGRAKYKRHVEGGQDGEVLSDLYDSDIDKLSDQDSGMDEEEGDVDVVLNKDQQQMIVNMLFDEEMNLRPQFARDENGRIIRRLDGTVIYDPHTGRFTFKKRLGRIFKVPRLKRNDKGRPLGGYVEDEFGPRRDELAAGRKSSSAHRARSNVSSRSAKDTRSMSGDLKRARSRGEGRNVGFNVPEDDTRTILDDELEYNKRGRHDVGSAIRRTLHKRLFKKKRKHKEDMLPDVKVRRAWGDESGGHGGTRLAGPGSLTPLGSRGGRVQQSSPWAQRRTPGTGDAEHWQMYREGLQSDRKILENLQEKLNRSHDRPFSPSGALVDTDWDYGDDKNNTGYSRGYSYLSEDGRLIIRERGCPELQQTKQPLFTIIRRPGDFEGQDQNAPASEGRQVKSAPMHVQEYTGDMSEAEQGKDIRRSDESLKARSMDGRCSQISSIDDNKLRRLLEELYKDKKYFDKYMEKTEPKSEAIIHSRGLAEHGRGYLLERADFWERRGPLPPRPPMTEVGWKMQREQTLAASRQASVMNSTMTCTPDLNQEPTHMPGLIETPRENESNANNSASRDSLNESVI